MENYVCTLSEDIQKQAREQLNENPATRDSDIQIIRSWIQSQPHINAPTDSYTILRYLRGCKFSIEKAKKKIEKYYTFKTVIPELFNNRDPTAKSMQIVYDLKLMVPLPGYDSEGRKVILGRLGAWDPGTFHLEDLFRAASMLFDILFREDEQISVTGFVQVHDIAGLTLKHVSAVNFALIRKVMTVWTEGYAIRPKAVHYLNTSSAFKTVFNLFAIFMKPKMRSRIKIHGKDMESLYSHVPQSMFPVEYGGTEFNLQDINYEWEKKLKSYKKWFEKEDKYKVEVIEKPGTVQSIADFFGISSFFSTSSEEQNTLQSYEEKNNPHSSEEQNMQTSEEEEEDESTNL